jgi:hypothetical protein
MATCPFVATAVATGRLQVLNTADCPLASVDEAVRLGDSGGGNLGTKIFPLFARGNHSRILNAPDGGKPLAPAGTFSLMFGGSQGAHPGHSGILLGDPEAIGQGRLDPAQFDRLASHADKNGRLSIDAVGDFIAENLKRDPKAKVLPVSEFIRDKWRLLREVKHAGSGEEAEKSEAIEKLAKLLGADHLLASAGEWGLLFAFLRNSPRSDDGDIALADVRMMFIDKEFPDGWASWEKSTADWIKATTRLARDAAFAYHFGWK